MDSLYTRLLEYLEAGEAVAIATIIATRGSTPREAGAKMLVRRSGAIVGTVGGGCGEAQVWRTALQVLETGQPQVTLVDLTGEISMDSGAVCGGTMEVLVEPWGTEEDPIARQRDLQVAGLLAERCRRRRASVLATVVAAGPGAPCRAGDRTVLGSEGLLLGGPDQPHGDSDGPDHGGEPARLDERLAGEATRALETRTPFSLVSL